MQGNLRQCLFVYFIYTFKSFQMTFLHKKKKKIIQIFTVGERDTEKYISMIFKKKKKNMAAPVNVRKK